MDNRQSTIDIPADLIDLHQDIRKLSTNFPVDVKHAGVPHAVFRISIQTLSEKYEDSQDQQALYQLARTHLEHGHYIVGRLRTLAMRTDVLDSAIKFITKHKQVHPLIQDHESARILAYIVTSRVHLITEKMALPIMHHVGDLVEQWTGVTLGMKEINSLEFMVGFLYGPAVWPLCREDVKIQRMLPTHLWRLGIPLSKITEPAQPRYHTAIPLPTDFI